MKSTLPRAGQRNARFVPLVLPLVTLVAAAACAAESGTQVVATEKGRVRVETFVDGLERPWGLAFLPDGRALVTEKAGRLRLVTMDGQLGEPLAGVPRVDTTGQGGLLDVALDPDFARNQTIYLSFAQPRGAGQNATRSAPLRPSIARASSGVAISSDSSSRMRRIFATCSALLSASRPLPI